MSDDRIMKDAANGLASNAFVRPDLPWLEKSCDVCGKPFVPHYAEVTVCTACCAEVCARWIRSAQGQLELRRVIEDGKRASEALARDCKVDPSRLHEPMDI